MKGLVRTRVEWRGKMRLAEARNCPRFATGEWRWKVGRWKRLVKEGLDGEAGCGAGRSRGVAGRCAELRAALTLYMLPAPGWRWWWKWLDEARHGR